MAQAESKLDRQWAFDTALNGLRAQGKFSQSRDKTCRYRFRNLRCAAGMLIPDERYQPKFDRKIMLASDPEVAQAIWPGADESDARFLGGLQSDLHDMLDGFERLETAARFFAVRWNLTYTDPAEQVS